MTTVQQKLSHISGRDLLTNAQQEPAMKQKCLEWKELAASPRQAALAKTGTLYIASAEGWRDAASTGVWHPTNDIESSKRAAEADHDLRMSAAGT